MLGVFHQQPKLSISKLFEYILINKFELAEEPRFVTQRKLLRNQPSLNKSIRFATAFGEKHPTAAHAFNYPISMEKGTLT